jgi:hypothetical protein
MDTVRLSVDQSTTRILEEIRLHLLWISEFVEQPIDFRDLIESPLRRALAFDLEFVRAGRTVEYRIILQRGEALLSLMATLGAFDRPSNGGGKRRS